MKIQQQCNLQHCLNLKKLRSKRNVLKRHLKQKCRGLFLCTKLRRILQLIAVSLLSTCPLHILQLIAVSLLSTCPRCILQLIVVSLLSTCPLPILQLVAVSLLSTCPRRILQLIVVSLLSAMSTTTASISFSKATFLKNYLGFCA